MSEDTGKIRLQVILKWYGISDVMAQFNWEMENCGNDEEVIELCKKFLDDNYKLPN
jgi:hypothetical protein